MHCLVENCEYKTDRHTDLTRHHKAKHVPEVEKYECSYKTCTKEFKRKDHLRDHCKRVHYRDLPVEYGGTGRRLKPGTSSNVGPSSNIQQATDELGQEMSSLDIASGEPREPRNRHDMAESSLGRPNNDAPKQANSSNAAYSDSSFAYTNPQSGPPNNIALFSQSNPYGVPLQQPQSGVPSYSIPNFSIASSLWRHPDNLASFPPPNLCGDPFQPPQSLDPGSSGRAPSTTSSHRRDERKKRGPYIKSIIDSRRA